VPKLFTHEIGDGLHGSAVVHEFSEQGAEQEYREELRDELRRAAHESLGPMGKKGFPRGGGRHQGNSRGEEKHAPASKRKPDKKSERSQYTGETHCIRPAAAEHQGR
jgi:hypothetical protein